MKYSSLELGKELEAADAQAPVSAARQMEVAAPQLRTIEAMLQDMASGMRPSVEALAQAESKPFLPTMPHEQYEAMKLQLRTRPQVEQAMRPSAETLAQAESMPFSPTMPHEQYEAMKLQFQTRPQVEEGSDVGVGAQEALAPIILTGPNIPGATNVDGLTPPDTHGAIGLDHFVEVTNSHIDIFPRAVPSSRTSISLASFFRYTLRVLFDPRVVYDNVWNRWIVTAPAFPESATRQLYFIAVSTTSNPLGSFWIYSLNVAFNSGDLWDYPQLGYDQDAVIFTANIFASTGAFRGADMFAVAKARLYNGLGFSVPIFQGLRGTLAPPIVLDQNYRTFLIAASGGSTLSLYTLTNSSKPNGMVLSAPVNIGVPAYSAPPDAPQPGTAIRLDTLDGRFVNASTQSGNSLWQVHTIALGGFAAPKYYQINTATNTVVRSAFFFGSASSYDFNASIAANGADDIYVTWTMTDPPNNINAQVRFSGWDHLNGAAYTLSPGTAAFTSPTWYGNTRWGDYSAVTVDPRNARRAWLVNENALASHDWGSRIVGIGF